MTCCFTGHRQMEEEERRLAAATLMQVLEKLYEAGYRRFFSGGALGFDLLAAECVLRLQATHSDVHLVMAIPCADQTRTWPQAERDLYDRICYCADEMNVLSPHYYQGCMQVRNKYMVDRSAFCICWLRSMRGGTAYTVSCAVKSGLQVLNLAVEDLVQQFLMTGMT